MPVDWIRLGDRAQDTEMRVIDLVAQSVKDKEP